ncbi:MAG TPA: hypothetical protein VFH85_09890 [Gammaproteobacteria bacterium]|nr:hypothetical protein [Gammaproteobacteria bacterium]
MNSNHATHEPSARQRARAVRTALIVTATALVIYFGMYLVTWLWAS